MVNVEAAVAVCPGCGLQMPPAARAHYDGYYHTSAECWSVYTEVLAAEFANVVLFGAVHQLTVDTYALQHAGGDHKAKSVCVHLVGLHLQIEEGVASPHVARRLKTYAERVDRFGIWPTFTPPSERASLNVFDVAMAADPQEHADVVRRWSCEVWDTWHEAHDEVAGIVYSQGLI